ncbi:MAG: globin [Gemmatimonadales bacterium]|nr:globin [Gemmatimonadales bacterium]
MDQSSNSATERTAMCGLAKASYDRCCAVPDFFPSFYQHFFTTRPDVRPLFAKTDFRRQHNLLRHALSLLLIYPNKPEAEGRSLLRRVAERHSRADLAIDPSLYEPFIDALMLTVKQHDPEFSPEIEAAWRATVQQGVEYMMSKY